MRSAAARSAPFSAWRSAPARICTRASACWLPARSSDTATPTRSPESAGEEQEPAFAARTPYENVGFRPDGIAIAGGAVWVISHDRTGIVWIDPETRTRMKAEPIPFGSSSIAADGGRVF